MRVCFVSGEFPPMQGGVGDYTSVLARTLSDMGVSATVVTSIEAAPERLDAGVSVLPIANRWGWKSLAAVERAARQRDADIVHVQYQAAAYGMLLPIHLLPTYLGFRLPSARRVVTFHDLKVPYLFPKAGRLRQRAVGQLMRGSDAVILTNREDLEALPSFGADRPAHLIPIGSNIQPRLPLGFERGAWRARWGIAPQETVLAYFGFLNATKGGDTLIDALAELVRRGRSVKLLMIGGKVGASDPTNQQFAQQVEAHIQREGLASHVIWTGHLPQEQVSAAFAASDMAVLPYSDGVSFRRGSLMAALAHGVPVITTVPGVHLPELVQEQNIILVAPEHPREIADAAMRIADHAGLRTRLGEGARRLSDLFAWERIAQETVALYESLLEGRLDS